MLLLTTHQHTLKASKMDLLHGNRVFFVPLLQNRIRFYSSFEYLPIWLSEIYFKVGTPYRSTSFFKSLAYLFIDNSIFNVKYNGAFNFSIDWRFRVYDLFHSKLFFCKNFFSKLSFLVEMTCSSLSANFISKLAILRT